MRLKIVSVSCLSFALASVAGGQAVSHSTPVGAKVSSSQLKKMTADAHTPDQYAAIAAAYAQQQAGYQAQADEEKQEWARRSTNIMLTAAKYPRPVDSARNLYEYYAYKAAQAGQFAAKYSKLAAPSSGTSVN